MYFKITVLTCLLAVASARYVTDFKDNISPIVSRILGGHNAKPGQFPHQISLQLVAPKTGVPYTHYCGGSILNRQWILTAAHCLTLMEEIDDNVFFAVKAGKHNLNKTEDTEQISYVDKIFIHELYDKKSEKNVTPHDIGLIKLQTPLRLNERVVPVSLPTKDSVPTGDVTLSGWGAINSNPKYPEMPDILQTVELQIIDYETCNNAMVELYLDQRLPHPGNLVFETNICSGPTTGGISVCGGDSGGPLISKDNTGKIEVVGVVSWGVNPCGFPGAPSVYVRTSAYIGWIQDTISTN